MEQKPRTCETVAVRSLHPDLAPVGSVKYMTPDEAKLMALIKRGEYVSVVVEETNRDSVPQKRGQSIQRIAGRHK